MGEGGECCVRCVGWSSVYRSRSGVSGGDWSTEIGGKELSWALGSVGGQEWVLRWRETGVG